MSKIEKALKKARAAVNIGYVSDTQDEAQQLVKVVESEVESKPDYSASKAIRLMREEKLLNDKELAHNKIIHPEMAESYALEAFREIRTKIISKTKGRNCTIMVTSLSKESGNSFVSLNLAVAFSFDESKTALLVDCNLADPSYRELIPPVNGFGLSDYFGNDDLRIEEIIHPVGLKGLRLIPAGEKRNIAGECLTSIKIRNLLQTIKTRYCDRFIIIDAPPVVHSADAHVLAEISDYILLVVPYGKYTESRIADATNAIGTGKLLGVIFNDEPQLPGPPLRIN